MIALACCAAACATASFKQFDASFDPKPAAKDPEVLEDAAAHPAEYRMVGLIEISKAESLDVATIVEKVRKHGRELGCEAVMREPPPEPDDDAPPPPVDVTRGKYLCLVRA